MNGVISYGLWCARAWTQKMRFGQILSSLKKNKQKFKLVVS